ncbi:MAG: SDR family NAD(P)-dependent oxidoreductase [Vicinamibacterales bacterium]
MNVMVLGATKGIGRAVARAMVTRGDRLHLLGRDPEELARSARDLQVRAHAAMPVTWSLCDLGRPETFGSVVREADAALGGCDTAVITAGLFGTQDALEADRALAARVLTLDFVNTVLLCEELRELFLRRGGGTLCVFGSVAGDRGRKPVVLYGAAKAGLSRYLEGLDHRFRSRGLRTVCIKPGFVRTSMTEGLEPPPFAAEPEDVVPGVLAALDRGTPVAYVPAIWAAIMLAIRLLPRAVLRRVDF